MINRRTGAPPQNIEAEKALLGAIFVKNDLLFEVVDIVAAADFFEPYHGELFKLMRDLIEARHVVTPVTILSDISQDAEVSGGMPASRYLAELSDNAPPALAEVAKSLAVTIKDNAMKRRIIDAAGEIMEACYSAPASVPFDELRSKLDNSVMSLYLGVGDLGIQHVATVGDRLIDRAQKARKIVGLEVGLKSVADLIGPLMPGRVYSILGASGAGKSVVAQQIGRFVARPIAGEPLRPVLYEQIEMDEEEMTQRALSSATGISGERIESAVLDIPDLEKLVDANEAQRPSGFHIDALTAPTVARIEARAVRMMRLHGLSLLIIDQLHYIEKPERRMSDAEAIGPNMRAIKLMAKRLDIPVIVLAPLKSTFHEGPVRRPEIRDLFNPGAMDANSDVMLFIHSPEYMLRRREPPEGSKDKPDWAVQIERWRGKVEFILGKRRGGEGFGSREAYFDRPRLTIADNMPRSMVNGELPF